MSSEKISDDPQTSEHEPVHDGSEEALTTGPKSDLAATNERIAHLESELYRLLNDRDERIKELDQTRSDLARWRRQAASTQQRLRKKIRADRVDFVVLLVVVLIFIAILIS